MRFYSIGFTVARTKSNKSISYHNNKSSSSIKANARGIQSAFSPHSRQFSRNRQRISCRARGVSPKIPVE
jgi:hypothetical protein